MSPSRSLLCAAAALTTASLALPCPAQGLHAVDEVRIPFVVVASGRAPSESEISSVCAAIGSPLLAGRDLADVLSLADGGAQGDPASFAASHEKALDDFFSGDRAGAAEVWRAISAAADAHPAILALRPELRSVVFEGRLYLALIAYTDRDDGQVERWIAAAARIEDMDPAATDFPPWVRERFSVLRAELAGLPKGDVELVDATDCELWLDGRRIGAGPGHYAVSRGRHAVLARCNGDAGLLREVEIGVAPVKLAPSVLGHLTVSRTGDQIELASAPEVTDDQIASDVSVIARAAGAERALALVGRAGSTAVLLVDETGVLRGAEIEAGDVSRLTDAIETLASAEERADGSPREERKNPWYRDGLAWGLLASGLAVWGTGLALGQVYGSPSAQEPFAWALMAGGGVLAGTGGVLFFVPSIAPSPRGEGKAALSLGVSGGVRF